MSGFWTCHECGAEMYGFENCQFCGAHKGGGEAMTDNRATELREKLDELGIEHFDYDKGGRTQTQWEAPDGKRHFTYETSDNPAKTARLVIAWHPTPEQAIAATLGGECKWVWVESWTDTTDGRECDYAHWMPDCGCWSEYDHRFSDFDDYAEKPTGIAFCERCGKAVKR